MAVLCDVNHDRLSPAEQEVAHSRAGGNSNAQVCVVSHEDEHQHVADHHLDDVQHSLQEVGGAEHPVPERRRSEVNTTVSVCHRA